MRWVVVVCLLCLPLSALPVSHRLLERSEDPSGGTQQDAEQAQAFFGNDPDGDGKITKDELEASLRGRGEANSSEQAQKTLEQFDKDGNGFLDLNEFLAMMGGGHAAPSTPSTALVETGTEIEAAAMRLLDHLERKGGNICWKKTYDRGVGTIPNVCTDARQNSYEAGLCYKRCNSDEHGAATMCIKNQCPYNYCDAGLFCTYCGGPLLKGKGCCCTIFGCCGVNCGEGYDDDGGCLCRAKSVAKTWDRGVGWIPTGCPSGKQNEAGLCYTPCGSGYTSFATSCWGVCTGNSPFDCGMACAGSQAECIGGIFDMVLAPLMIVVNIATAGELGAAIKAGKLAAQTALKMGAKELINAAAKRLAKGATADAVKGTLKTMAKEAGKFLKDAAVDTIVTSAAKTGLTGEPPEFDLTTLTMLDPTGISDVVIAYANPICG